jgi:formylmethanofuran dehydrogenase subunit C
VDSNGNIVINGGTISVTGNSTFDYEGTGVINGGTVIVNGQQVSTLPNQMMGGPGMGGPGMGWRP